jgi:tRNA pseudouridine38-40 synthase
MPTHPAEAHEVPPPRGGSAILLTVAYDGRAFCGFAPQREGRTIHGVLGEAVRALDPEVGRLRGVSRTDAGVHALGQRVSFDTERAIPPKGWVLGVNAHLPPDLAVRAARQVAPGYDPRAWSRGKRYRYVVLIDRIRDPLIEPRAFRVDPPFDLDRARAEAEDLIGTHDFRAFRTSADERTDTTRTLRRVDLVVGHDPRILEIVVEGNAFLHNMVRILVGTLVDVARGRLRPGAVDRALASGARSDLGITAPAHGLVLDEVFLDPAGDLEGGAAWP